MKKTTSPLGQAALFVGLTYLVSIPFYLQMIFRGGLVPNMHLLIFFVWIPGVVAMACSKYFGHRIKDAGFRRADGRAMTTAYAMPALCAVASYVLILAFRIGVFGMTVEGGGERGWGEHVLKGVLTPAVLGVLVAFVFSLGEEIGWRGFLFERFKEAGVRRPGLATGLIWSAWHWPAIVFSDYSSSDKPLLSAFLFTVSLTSLSVFLHRQRAQTNSLWPAVLSHSVHNMWVLMVVPALLVAGPLGPYFIGESGVILAAVYFVTAIYFARKPLRAG